MNERIKQLADQALKECDAAKERGIDQYSKRFAELIVRECAGIAQTYMSRWPEDHELTKQIKQHFGVEE